MKYTNNFIPKNEKKKKDFCYRVWYACYRNSERKEEMEFRMVESGRNPVFYQDKRINETANEKEMYQMTRDLTMFKCFLSIIGEDKSTTNYTGSSFATTESDYVSSKKFISFWIAILERPEISKIILQQLENAGIYLKNYSMSPQDKLQPLFVFMANKELPSDQFINPRINAYALIKL